VNRGYLDAAKRSDRFEIAWALGRFLDRVRGPITIKGRGSNAVTHPNCYIYVCSAQKSDEVGQFRLG
jgi:hypothetical protein